MRNREGCISVRFIERVDDGVTLDDMSSINLLLFIFTIVSIILGLLFRANKIRKMFDLGKDDDVRKYVVRREIEGKKKVKAPKIQRLITQTRLQRKRRYKASLVHRHERARTAKEDYKSLMEDYNREKKEKRAAELAKKKKTTSKA